MDCGYSLEPPRRGSSNEYPQSMFWAEIWKISQFFFYLKILNFLEEKCPIYLNRRVFVMNHDSARGYKVIRENEKTNNKQIKKKKKKKNGRKFNFFCPLCQLQ